MIETYMSRVYDFSDYKIKVNKGETNVSLLEALMKEDSSRWVLPIKVIQDKSIVREVYVTEKAPLFAQYCFYSELDECLDALVEISKGVEDLQKINIIHGDLHTYNAFACDKYVKIFDWNLSRFYGKNNRRFTEKDKSQIREKNPHIPPEALENNSPLDGKYDVYSLGHMLKLIQGMHGSIRGNKLIRNSMRPAKDRISGAKTFSRRLRKV